MQIDFDYKTEQDVKILAIDVLGKIDALMYQNKEKKYHVIYWDDGQRKSDWVYSWEISVLKDK